MGTVSNERSRPVVVKRMPERMTLPQARAFLREVQPFLIAARPKLVFDLSTVRQMDFAGVGWLLRCLDCALRRDGDFKLGALSPQSAVVLELCCASSLF